MPNVLSICLLVIIKVT